jgi:hypothetical protein
LWQSGTLHLFFLAGPVWLLTAVLYVAFAALAGARGPLPEASAEPDVATRIPVDRSFQSDHDGLERPSYGRRVLVHIYGGVALLCLSLCLGLPLGVFASSYSGMEAFRANAAWLKTALVWITIVYFIAATLWLSGRQQRSRE